MFLKKKVVEDYYDLGWEEYCAYNFQGKEKIRTIQKWMRVAKFAWDQPSLFPLGYDLILELESQLGEIYNNQKLLTRFRINFSVTPASREERKELREKAHALVSYIRGKKYLKDCNYDDEILASTAKAGVKLVKKSFEAITPQTPQEKVDKALSNMIVTGSATPETVKKNIKIKNPRIVLYTLVESVEYCWKNNDWSAKIPKDILKKGKQALVIIEQNCVLN